ncbi:MAG TPA: hypothetical protein VIL91_07620, partial [Gaiellaceae bacterium]
MGGGREAAVVTTGRRAATASCAAVIVVLGSFVTPALASDGTSTPAAANATEVPSDLVTASQATQSIAVTTSAPASAVYNTSFTVAATGGGSGNAVTFSSSGACSNSGARFTMTSGTGTCSVNYNQAGDANYLTASQVTELVTASQVTQSITVTTSAPASAVYNTSFTVAATGGGSGNAVTFNSSGACSNSGATFTMTSGTGSCSVSYNQPGDANYLAASQVTELVNSAPEQQGSTATTITQQAKAGAVVTQEGASNSIMSSSGESQTGGGVAQGNGASADASASTDASVALEQQPGAGSTDVVLTTDLTQAVGATAEVYQGATNTSIVVRNDAAGDDGPVSQTNTAGATASGSAIGTTAGNADVSQDVQAGAVATQSGVANTNVSVRVGSPGDSGTVSQTNTATATATAEASDLTAATQAESTARQDGAANTNVSVRVFSPGDDGAVTQANAASASATATDAAAQAEQTGVRNTNVSIRIQSPGSEGDATQGSSSATATDGPESAETAAKTFDVENHDGNTEVQIGVNDPDLADPTSNSAGLVTVWQWTWQWEYDEALGLTSDLDQAGSGWNWGTGGDVSVTSVPVTPDLAPGSFVWSWDWQRDGGQTWTWDLSAPLSCSCIWIWNWVWTWNGSSANADGTAPEAPAATSTAVEQQNNATAVAEASVVADVSQASTHDDDPGTSFAGQLVDVTQLAVADASAAQSDTLNELWAAGTQANVARADALASGDAFVTQELVQARGGPKETSQWAGQQVRLGQLLLAQAAASQSDSQNLGSSQTTLAAADAEALALAETSQQVDQLGLSLGGTQVQWAGQQTSLVQMARGVALVGQSGARGGASALASTSAAAKAITIQGAEQKAIGGFGFRYQRSAQLAVVNQLGTSTATTIDSTSQRTNREASSKAITLNAGLVEQRAAQELAEGSLISIQDSTQQTSLDQLAHAYSPSLGGKAGTATVVNCATVGQASGQGMGGPVVV